MDKKEIDRKKIGKNSRAKGHNSERKFAAIFRELGYPFCKTSRQASRLLDDSKVDLAFLPFNVQIKAGKQRGFNPIKELKDMAVEIKKNFPPNDPIHRNPSLIILDKEVGRGSKKTKFDTTVTLPFEDFKQFLIFKQKGNDKKNK